MISGVVPPSPTHKMLTEKQKGQIRSAFGKTIEACDKVTMTDVQKTLRQIPTLYFLSFSKNRVKQVVNYVNYLAKIGGATSTPPVSEVPKEA